MVQNSPSLRVRMMEEDDENAWDHSIDLGIRSPPPSRVV